MLFHSPNTHSTDAPILLEALDADCDLHVLSMKAGEQRGAAYLAVNPVGKVPAVKHGEALVTEQVAVFLYLADLYPEAGLTPAIATRCARPAGAGWRSTARASSRRHLAPRSTAPTTRC